MQTLWSFLLFFIHSYKVPSSYSKAAVAIA